MIVDCILVSDNCVLVSYSRLRVSKDSMLVSDIELRSDSRLNIIDCANSKIMLNAYYGCNIYFDRHVDIEQRKNVSVITYYQ